MDDTTVFVGPHFLTDFREDPFQHRLFDYRTGSVHIERRSPKEIRSSIGLRKALADAAPISIGAAGFFVLAWLSVYSLPSIMERILQPDSLLAQVLAIVIVFFVFLATLAPTIGLAIMIRRHSQERVNNNPLRLFSGRSVAFSKTVVEETLLKIDEAKKEIGYLLANTDVAKRTWDEDPAQDGKGGRPGVLREKMASAYLELYPEGHGQIPLLKVLRRVNASAGTDGSPDTLKRAIKEAKRRQNP